MSKFSSRVARTASLARRGSILPLTVQFLCSQWWIISARRPGCTALHVMPQCTNSPPSFRKSESILHREKGKRPMNVIFYLLFLVGGCWHFYSWHALVNQSCQGVSRSGLSQRLPLVPLSRLLTSLSGSNVCFTGSSLPVGLLLHTAGLSLYFKEKNEHK